MDQERASIGKFRNVKGNELPVALGPSVVLLVSGHSEHEHCSHGFPKALVG